MLGILFVHTERESRYSEAVLTLTAGPWCSDEQKQFQKTNIIRQVSVTRKNQDKSKTTPKSLLNKHFPKITTYLHPGCKETVVSLPVLLALFSLFSFWVRFIKILRYIIIASNLEQTLTFLKLPQLCHISSSPTASLSNILFLIPQGRPPDDVRYRQLAIVRHLTCFHFIVITTKRSCGWKWIRKKKNQSKTN